jgi:hypothetical protein
MLTTRRASDATVGNHRDDAVPVGTVVCAGGSVPNAPPQDRGARASLPPDLTSFTK